MGTLPLAISQGTASHTRQEAQAVLSGTAAPVWAPARAPRGTVHAPTSLSCRQIEPGLPMLEGRAGPLFEWAYSSASWKEFSGDRNKIARDLRPCGGCRDILLSPSYTLAPWGAKHAGFRNVGRGKSVMGMNSQQACVSP